MDRISVFTEIIQSVGCTKHSFFYGNENNGLFKCSIQVHDTEISTASATSAKLARKQACAKITKNTKELFTLAKQLCVCHL